MKARLIFSIFAFLFSLFALCLSSARSQSIDSLVAQATNESMAQDSLEASSTVMVPFRAEIARVARKRHLPPALLAAFIQEESGFNPWAGRTEPGYLKKKKIIHAASAWSKAHAGIPTPVTELHDRSRSFGPMQVMGEVAREQGYDSLYLASLYSPFNSIDEGAKLLKSKLAAYPNDTLSAISAYNQGNNRRQHGHFANARYVYRVSTAWEAYDRIFKYKKGTSHEVGLNQDSARAIGARTPDPRDQATDSALTARQHYVKNGLDAGYLRYDSRHDPPNGAAGASQSEPALGFDRHDRDGLIALGAFLVLLGLTYMLRRWLERVAGHAECMLRNRDGQFPHLAAHGQPGPYSA